MPLKDIIVQLDDSGSSDTRLNLAVDLAKKHEAVLTGLLVAPPRVLSQQTRSAWYHMSNPGLMSAESRKAEESHKELVERGRKEVSQWENGFKRHLKRSGVSGDWIVAEESLPDALTRYARFCDVAIVGQFDSEITRVHGHAATDLLLHSVGHAVMVVPLRIEFKSLADRIMIAWDRSPVALRAVHNARPFLRSAKEVKVVAVNIESEFRGQRTGSGICEHLARHGIAAEPLHITTKKHTKLSDALLSTAADLACDLLVMGAYGRSGLRERVLGSVTSTILSDAKIPVLLSH
ncbi:MAG: universal stress protein [Pseudomonadota bacterium]